MGANLLSCYSPKRLCSCSLLSHWRRGINTSPSHPAPWHAETGSSTVAVAKERGCSTVWVSCQESAGAIQHGEKSSEGLHFELPLLSLYQIIPHPAAMKKLLERSEITYCSLAVCQFSEAFFFFFKLKPLKLLLELGPTTQTLIAIA